MRARHCVGRQDSCSLTLGGQGELSGDIWSLHLVPLSLSWMTEATVEAASRESSTRQTMPGGTCHTRDRISLTPMKTSTAATPYFSSENSLASTSMMKKVARRPSIAKTADVYARNRSLTCATMALTESTAKRMSLISRQHRTRKSMVARSCVRLRPPARVASAACLDKSTAPYRACPPASGFATPGASTSPRSSTGTRTKKAPPWS
mmetsp:Transcript_106797/g.278875  ORF Transcript_106797/g.278875 Transcript_106797/m.278875 type:complete len:207 (-) Transcript_106797:831-1451(-)